MSAPEIAPGVHCFTKTLPYGWALNMLAVRGLDPEGLVLHSPTFIDDATFAAVEALGPVRVLVCPNHYHHLSVGRYQERFPGARVVAGAGAIPRLTKRLGFAPEAASFPEWRTPAGLANGEGWIVLPDGPTWIVSDAFFNVASLRGVAGAALRWLRTGPGLSLGQTFRWLGVRDAKAFRAWLFAELDKAPPRRVLFSHGDPIEGDDVADRLRALCDARL